VLVLMDNHEELPPGLDRRSPLRVLLVSRYGPLARPLTRGLTEEGFTVAVAAGPEEAYARARTGDADVIILDLMGPKEAGLALLQGWRSAGLKTPVLVLTAPDGVAEPVPGADAWLAKPFELDELFRRLRALVGGTS
jgi:DNA-binding response OmpR family regulator